MENRIRQTADGVSPSTAALMRGLGQALGRYVLPELQSGEACERAEFARQVSDRLAAELSLPASNIALHQENMGRVISEIASFLGTAAAEDPAPAASLAELRGRLAEQVRQLADHESQQPRAADGIKPLWASIRRVERELRADIDRYRTPPPGAVDATSSLTADQLTETLRQALPDAGSLSLTGFRILPGGRSKTTVFASLAGYPAWPAEVVLRQDMTTGVVDTRDGATKVANEFPILQAAARAGLPVPRPLFLQAEPGRAGPPFMITARASGKAPGDWRGFAEPGSAATRASVRHLAEVLAQLHRIDLRHLPLQHELALSPEERMQREIDYRWTKWTRDTVEASPIIESALARLRRECRHGLGGPALVHGDVLPHNLLVDGDRISALLDWEFVHVGDPAEDLAYCRAAVSAVMPWDEFVALYCAAGGQPVDERRLLIFGLWGLVRNCSFAASAARLYLDQGTQDFTTGAIGYVSIPLMETHIATLLDAMG